MCVIYVLDCQSLTTNSTISFYPLVEDPYMQVSNSHDDSIILGASVSKLMCRCCKTYCACTKLSNKTETISGSPRSTTELAWRCHSALAVFRIQTDPIHSRYTDSLLMNAIMMQLLALSAVLQSQQLSEQLKAKLRQLETKQGEQLESTSPRRPYPFASGTPLSG